MSQFHTLASSSEYLEALLERYRTDPGGVPHDWRAALDILLGYFPGLIDSGARADHFASAAVPSAHVLAARFAHLAARLDPLDRALPQPWQRLRAEFEQRLSQFERSGVDAALAQLLQACKGPIAIETGHLDDPARLEWMEDRFAKVDRRDHAARARALLAITRAEAFEQFMALRFPGKKRFGSEGAEALYALVQRVLDRAAAAGVKEVVIGTMHRGRLGLMGPLLGQPLDELFARMKGGYPFSISGKAADVPYHLGFVGEHVTPAGRLTVRLLPNPSHLEAINAVALGFARSRQETLGSAAVVLPLILHTDASAVGQGVVAEALQFSELPGYKVAGSINVVVNNQLGFTTEPTEGRSSRHCTAAWKAIDSLIAHVNGDDVDSVLAATDLAFDYREAFSGESVIDLVCVRANGHNELDEPRFTQPRYYELAAARTPLSARYAAALLADGAIQSGSSHEMAQQYRTELESAYERQGSAQSQGPRSSPATGPTIPQALSKPDSSPRDRQPSLEVIAQLAARVPEDGEFNPKAVRLVRQRAEEWRTAVTWATAEILALGKVLAAGGNVRLTGQDVDRGAFSQRHLSMIDTRSGRRRQVFESAPPGWGSLQVYNSPLCEYAALAYEYGYSVAAEKTLDIWEAQFGDFANAAQVVLDQFIASGEEKWGQHSGLVVLLPHGLEGQGPEHSSARIERMLHLAACDNLRIVHPSTPANYYHLLSSQTEAGVRRPLLIFTPKRLLRLKAATSPPSALEAGQFQPVIVRRAPNAARRVVLCSGKIYYDLLEGPDSPDITFIRLEQLYPFPEAALIKALEAAPGAQAIWLQEEPANYGCWSWLRPHLEAAMGKAGLRGSPTLIARPPCPSPAGSFHENHESNQRALIAEALDAGARVSQRDGAQSRGSPSVDCPISPASRR